MEAHPHTSLKAVCGLCSRVWMITHGAVKAWSESFYARSSRERYRYIELDFQGYDGSHTHRRWLCEDSTWSGQMQEGEDIYLVFGVTSKGLSEPKAFVTEQGQFLIEDARKPLTRHSSFYWTMFVFFCSGLMTRCSREEQLPWLGWGAWILVLSPVLVLFARLFSREGKNEVVEPTPGAAPTAIQVLDKQIRQVTELKLRTRDEIERWKSKVKSHKDLERRMRKRSEYDGQLEVLKTQREQLESVLLLERALLKSYQEQQEGLEIEREKVLVTGQGDTSISEHLQKRLLDHANSAEALREQLLLVQAESELSTTLGSL